MPNLTQERTGCDYWEAHSWTPEAVDRVACSATVLLTDIDVKMGTYELRWNCQWLFRTSTLAGDSEIGFRGVPGIQVASLPGLHLEVQESRVWKDLSGVHQNKSSNTILWRGTSRFVMTGRELFDVRQFPFDRQLLNFEEIVFVWRTSKEDDDFFDTMKIGQFMITFFSTLPEWQEDGRAGDLEKEPTMTMLKPLSRNTDNCCNHFSLQIQLQRQPGFFLRQVFYIAVLITLAAITPLAVPLHEETQALTAKLQIYGAGFLCLVAFKYGISDRLPTVPYNTSVDDFLLSQIHIIGICVLESLCMAWSIEQDHHWMDTESADEFEWWLFVLIAIVEFLGMLYMCFWKPCHRVDWSTVERNHLHSTPTFEELDMSSYVGRVSTHAKHFFDE